MGKHKPRISREEQSFNYACSLADYTFSDEEKKDDESFFVKEARENITKILNKYGIKEDTQLHKAMIASYFLGAKNGQQR